MSLLRHHGGRVRPGRLRLILVAGGLAAALAMSLALSGCGSLATTTTTSAPASSTSTSSATGGTAPATTSTTQVSQSSVTAYAALYSTLDATLNSAQTYLASQGPAGPHPLTFGTELLPANGNRGPDLLQAGVLPSVDLYLTRLKELGIQGVTVEIGYPLLMPSFPRSSDYVGFFKQVAAEVRTHGMKLDVETNVVFSNTPFSTITTSFAGLTLAQFAKDMLAMDQTVIDNLHPDYLDLCAEPDTDAELLGLPALNDPQNFSQFVKTVAGGLRKGSTLVGAGGATWESPAFDQVLVNLTSLDFICLHVYPLSPAILQYIVASSKLAVQHGKKLVVDEAWLYKVATGQLAGGVAGAETVMRRDVYSFWQPLDEKFMQTITQLAEVEGIQYVSPFWSRNFFAYLPYDAQAAGASYAQLAQAANTAAGVRIQGDQFSPVGTYYKSLIATQVNKGF